MPNKSQLLDFVGKRDQAYVRAPTETTHVGHERRTQVMSGACVAVPVDSRCGGQ